MYATELSSSSSSAPIVDAVALAEDTEPIDDIVVSPSCFCCDDKRLPMTTVAAVLFDDGDDTRSLTKLVIWIRIIHKMAILTNSSIGLLLPEFVPVIRGGVIVLGGVDAEVLGNMAGSSFDFLTISTSPSCTWKKCEVYGFPLVEIESVFVRRRGGGVPSRFLHRARACY
ncbi:hypothetical protein ACA910_000878 [Epithemia clementina (nom. ined.)]